MVCEPLCPAGQPRVAWWHNEYRLVETADGGRIRDCAGPPLHARLAGLGLRYRWIVATCECPYCGELHEHPMSSYSRWGTFTAVCDRARAYCLTREIAA